AASAVRAESLRASGASACPAIQGGRPTARPRTHAVTSTIAGEAGAARGPTGTAGCDARNPRCPPDPRSPAARRRAEGAPSAHTEADVAGRAGESPLAGPWKRQAARGGDSRAATSRRSARRIIAVAQQLSIRPPANGRPFVNCLHWLCSAGTIPKEERHAKG